jgi:hypothetical protein
MASGLVELWSLAISALEAALDDPTRGATSESWRCDVIAAAEMIKLSSEEIYCACINGKHPRLSLEKWQGWMERFDKIVEKVTGKVGDAASIAVCEMLRVSQVFDIQGVDQTEGEDKDDDNKKQDQDADVEYKDEEEEEEDFS